MPKHLEKLIVVMTNGPLVVKYSDEGAVITSWDYLVGRIDGKLEDEPYDDIMIGFDKRGSVYNKNHIISVHTEDGYAEHLESQKAARNLF